MAGPKFDQTDFRLNMVAQDSVVLRCSGAGVGCETDVGGPDLQNRLRG